MTKTQLVRFTTPGLSVRRIVFTTYGGSAHGVLVLEELDKEAESWEEIDRISSCNGGPMDAGFERIDDTNINQFTGEAYND